MKKIRKNRVKKKMKIKSEDRLGRKVIHVVVSDLDMDLLDNGKLLLRDIYLTEDEKIELCLQKDVLDENNY